MRWRVGVMYNQCYRLSGTQTFPSGFQKEGLQTIVVPTPHPNTHTTLTIIPKSGAGM